MSTTNDGSTAQCGCRCGCCGRRQHPFPRITTLLFLAFLVLTPVGWLGNAGGLSDAASSSTTRGVKQDQHESSRGGSYTRGDHARASSQREADPVIEEVTAKQLERLLNEKDFVAVYWYARSCTTCDKVLAELEKIDDDTDTFGVDFVKINDKRLAKQYGIKTFPALTYFREKEPIIYDGDLMDEENVLEFLTSLEAMDLPDRIEEVNSKILGKIVEETDFVAVLFCPDTEHCTGAGSNKPDCKKCAKALQELENIDDEADQLGIGFVKIADERLAEEYNLGQLPVLVYYRHQIPIVYEHELSREEDVLEWLVANKSTGDEEDVIEDVTAKTLNTLIGNIDNLVVLFYDHGDEDSMQVLHELEKIDDDCDKHGIQFVKIDDDKAAKEFGIDSLPAIVYFEKQLPNVYDGDIENEDEILEWLLSQLEKDEIEDVTDEMLDRLVKEGKTLAVLFYDNNDRKSQRVLNELENIDDECDQLGIIFVKIDNSEEAKEYGIEKVPSLLYFEKGIPTLYEGNLEEEEKVLKWLEHQQKSDQIEDITDEMLDMVIEKMPHVAVLFYDKDQKKSQKILAELENIDDDCDQHNIAFVKIDDEDEAKEYGIDEVPTLVLFERKIPHIYEGDLMNEDQLLGWLLHQKKHSEIPEVTDEMMEKLIETTPYLAVLFYDKDDKQDMRILNELENIDDDLEKAGIVIVRLDNEAEAKEYGIDHLPTLVYFEGKIPAIYEGDLLNEDEVLKWLIEQKESATIEEVTDEILTDLIEEHEYVVVFFSGDCDDGDECDKVLEELENIDDELDETGIVFVTTEDTSLAKKHGIKSFPTLAFFRNKEPLIFKGDLDDEDEVLSWITDENTLEIPGKIEEVNSRMLENILEENDYVVVFFYKEGDKKSQKILQELENIDDECEEKDIDFVKISDDGIEKEYDLPSLPALAFYRHKFRQIYTGDMMHEEAILDWVLDLRTSTPDVIENVDRKTLQVLINDVEHLAVFFYDDKCESCPEILEELETIDDDTDKHGIQFVKSKDAKLAAEIGIFSFPALVYYETGVPIMYDGNLKKEDEVLEWLIEQKSNDKDDSTEDDNDDNDSSNNSEDNSNDNEGTDDDSQAYKDDTEEDKDGDDDTDNEDNDDNDDDNSDNDDDKSDDDTDNEDNDDDDNSDNDSDDDEDDDDDDNNNDNDDNIDNDTNENISDDNYDEDDDDDDDNSDNDDSSNEGDDSVDMDDDDDDDDDDERDEESEEGDNIGEKRKPNHIHSAKKKLLYPGDGCFYIGMGAKTAKPKIPSYQPYQCCPSKVKGGTKVAKVSPIPKNKLRENKPIRPTPIAPPALKPINKLSAKDIKKSATASAKDKPSKQPRAEASKKSKKGFFGSGNLLDEAEVLDWMVKQKNDASIEEIDRDTLAKYIETKEFLAVIFYKEEDPETPRVLRHVELIDDEASEYGIKIVQMKDRLMAKKYGYRNPPGITYFRKGKYINYDGEIDDEEEILDWLTNPENMELTDHIERINRKMFHKIRQSTDYLAVFFYSNDCKQCSRVLSEIEHIDDDADGAGIKFVKIDDKQLAKDYGVFALPGILFFKMGSKEPVIYAGDLYEEEQILQWLMTQKDPSSEVIEALEGEDLLHLIRESDSLAVYFWNRTLCDMCQSKVYRKQRRHKQEQKSTDAEASEDAYDSDDCEQCAGILEELENIDDDCDRHGVKFVKTQDYKIAEDYGATEFPVLVYFKNQVPNVFEGSLAEEEEVLQWLITQKTEDRIELITRVMLESSVEDTQYLAVYFYKQNCHICDEILEGLEQIDDECDLFGIHVVKIQDPQLAKRYSIKTFPALVYFRNGNPLLFEGDLQNEMSVLEWLCDDDVRELKDEIEAVNTRMLERLLDESPFLAVFFFEEGCPECNEIIEALEKIDGDADLFGIDFVKVSEPDAAEKYGILNLPSLVYFRKKEPLIYDSDLTQEDKILSWLTSQDVFVLKNEIDEVNKKMLDKLLDENEFLAVFFYDHDSKESAAVNEKLEEIDEETENLDITFVKMADPRYARKWGVTKLPAIVYFRKRFPSIYRGDIHNEQDVLDWLRKNRFRQPELNIYMYMLIAVAILFALYTGFLLSCFRAESPAPAAHHQKQA